jgi:hypothetical protein
MKCDEIDHRYSEFKKRKLKIFWWFQIISVQPVIKKAMWNMVTLRDKIIKEAIMLGKYNKITFWFMRFMRSKGPDIEERSIKTLRK